MEVSSSTMTIGSSRCPGARREYCLSLCLVKPVVKTRPFLRKMAREALLPSCATASSSMSPVLNEKEKKIVKMNVRLGKKKSSKYLGSTLLIFRSLQVKRTSEPSQFQHPEYTRSGRVNCTKASPVPTFQTVEK